MFASTTHRWNVLLALPYRILTPPRMSVICRLPVAPRTSRHAAGSVDDSSSYTLNSASGQQGAGTGDDPLLSNLGQDAFPAAVGVHNASIDQGADAEARRDGSGGAMRSDLRWKHWAMFVAGNLLSAAVIVSVIAQLTRVCFHARGSFDEGQVRPHHTRSQAQKNLFITLIYGLVAELWFAVCLSLAYRSPLGIKCMHKIPLAPGVFSGEHIFVFGLAPQLWSVVYLMGAGASQTLSSTSSCVRQGGSGLGLYLTVSGRFMDIVGYIVLGALMLGVCIQIGCTYGGCDAAGRKFIGRHIVSKCLLLGMFWELQSVVWIYRAGGFQLGTAVLLGVCTVVGAVMTSNGSVVPAMLRRPREDRNTTTS